MWIGVVLLLASPSFPATPRDDYETVMGQDFVRHMPTGKLIANPAARPIPHATARRPVHCRDVDGAAPIP